MQGIQREENMLVEQRKEALFQQLDLSGLEGWSAKNQATVCTLLAEYHDIFSLEPGELGCTDLVKHEIKVTNDEPFKERFWRIPPPMVDEVCSHMKEMLKRVQFAQARACGAMLLWWHTRTEVYASASTSVNWMQEPRTPTCCHRYRKQ